LNEQKENMVVEEAVYPTEPVSDAEEEEDLIFGFLDGTHI
jgi:hypothetical protein